MKRLFSALCFLPFACLGAEPAVDPWKSFSFTLEPGKVHEECQRVEAGQKRRYLWRSDGAVDFNIHFHEGERVSYPLKRDAMRGDGGTFSAKLGQDYCWMWTARKVPAKIEGRLELR